MRGKRAKTVDWTEILVQAVNTPGVLSDAYQRFWNYSVGNQLLAIFECFARGLQPGPIHTFKGWQGLGRHVKKGEKAITLCMPVSVKAQKENAKTKDHENSCDNTEEASGRRTIFVFRPNWFVLCQTDGKPYLPTELPEWSEARTLRVLEIERVEFTHPNGNCQGYAQNTTVAVSPIAALPHKTLFHEIAHVVLGHTAEGMLDDHERTPKTIREVEAECAALICCESLRQPGTSECRGYIQHWLKTGSKASPAIPEKSAQRIFKAADAILKAGRPPATELENS